MIYKYFSEIYLHHFDLVMVVKQVCLSLNFVVTLLDS